MTKLLKNVEVYEPKYIGKKDILSFGGKIQEINTNINLDGTGVKVDVIDCSGLTAIPGFIDQHVHVIGAGGEAGPWTRVPEIMFSEFIKAGVTTCVTFLGTDSVTRNLQDLLAKVRGLEYEGISMYMMTGSYRVPIVTITGDIRTDIVSIEKIIGVGELSISDSRSSQPTEEEMIRIATDVKIAGMLKGQKTTIHLHVGDGKDGLKKIIEIIKKAELPVNLFVPTHVNRKASLLKDSEDFMKMGGCVDLTSGLEEYFPTVKKPSKIIARWLKEGFCIDNMTVSSDGNGAITVFNKLGKIEKMFTSKLISMYKDFVSLVKYEDVDMETAVKPFTINPARNIGVEDTKGRIKKGWDADILLIDDKFQLDTVIAKGEVLMKNSKIQKYGLFEKDN